MFFSNKKVRKIEVIPDKFFPGDVDFFVRLFVVRFCIHPPTLI